MQRFRDYLWPLFFCAGGLVLAHHQTLLSGFRFTQNDLGDTRFNHYLLEHGWRWLLQRPGHGQLWSPGFFYPAKNVGAYSDTLLSAVPFYAPWRLLGAAPDTAFQLWLLSAGVLNFALAYLLFTRSFKVLPLGASAGAALFAFAGVRINQTMHPQLFPQLWSVLCVYALSRLFSSDLHEQTDRRRRGWIWVAGLSAAAQFWSGFYLGWFLAFGLTVGGVWALFLAPSRKALGQRVQRHPMTLALAAAASGLILVPLAQHYLAASKEVGMRSFGEALTMIPSPRAWLHLGPFSWAYGGMSQLPFFRAIPMEHEQRVGLGLVTSAACLIGVFWMGRKSPSIRLVALVALTVFLLASQLDGYTGWRWVFEYFPGAKAVRGVSRIALLLLLPMGLGLASCLNWLAARGRAAYAGAVLLSGLAQRRRG
jgi:hypothetical protein